MASNVFELSQQEVDRLVIAELQRLHPEALPITVDYEPRTEKGFCHCHWIPRGDGSGKHILNTLALPAAVKK